jgi:hypothetical protein
MKRNIQLLTIAFIILLSLSSCAPEGDTRQEYGFFSGWLHGFVFMFALIGKLFGADIGLYAQNNSGFLYWLGFIIGLGFLGGGGYSTSRR